ncbi:homeobox domain-containing protein, partial [Syncephalis pseudoplumigaleata]
MDESLFRTTLHGGFPIKPRHRTTKRQYSILERQFRRNPRPDAATRDALAAKLSMRGRTVQIWFQNRRAKSKR